MNPCGISLEMNFSDFKEYEKALSHGIVSEKTRPLLENVSVAEFRKGSTSMFYKCSHDTDEEFSETEYLIKRVHDGIREGDYFVPSRSHPRGVNSTKLQDIIAKLGPLMQPSRLQFYQDLPSSDLGDMISIQ